MNRLHRTLLLLMLLSLPACNTTSATIAAERPWDSLPADVNAVIHLDMKSLLDAELAQSLNDELKDLSSGAMGEFDELVAATGFDPGEDLETITIGGKYGEGNDVPFYMIVKGNFDLKKIDSYAKESGKVEIGSHEGLTTYTSTDTAGPMTTTPTVAWLDESTMIAAGPFDFPNFVRVTSGDAKTFKGSSLAKQIDRSNGQVLIAVDVPDEVRSDGAQLAFIPAPLKQLRTVLVALHVTADVDLSISAEADTEANGQLVQETLQGFVAMGKMMAAEEPQALELMEALSVNRDGKNVAISLRLTGAQIHGAMAELPAMAMGALGGSPTVGVTPSPYSGGDDADAFDTQDLSNPVGDHDGALSIVNDEPGSEPRGTGQDLDAQRNEEQPVSGSNDGRIGRVFRVTTTAGVETVVRLTDVDDDTLTFERNLGGGEIVFAMQRSEIASMEPVE